MIEMITSLFLVWFGFALRGWADFRHEDRAIRAHIDELGMEIRYCGTLAATYLHENITAPLYRLPNESYIRAMPCLLQAGLVTGTEVNTIQKFYLQVDQINRGLNNVDDFLRGVTTDNPGKGITLEKELTRLNAKMEELRNQAHGQDAADLYKETRNAFQSIYTEWGRNHWWKRFYRTRLRPLRERLRNSKSENG